MINSVALLLVALLATANGLAFTGGAPPVNVFAGFGLAFTAYVIGRRLPGRRDGWVFPLAALAAPPAAAAVSGTLAETAGNTALALFGMGIAVALPWLAGRYRRQQAALIAAGRDRVRHLEREREHVVADARRTERARIAADVHDSLGHELALLALRAGALELAPDLPEEHRKRAGELRASAASATETLRRAIGMLRDETGDAPGTAPAGEDADAVVARARAAGLDVRLDRDGDPGTAPAEVRRAVHRVVREALTNAAKHAAGAPVEVRVRYGGDGTRVAVSNAAPPAAEAAEDGVGRGLIGLDERVRLAGGTFRVRHDGGRFTVTAAFPGANGEGAA